MALAHTARIEHTRHCKPGPNARQLKKASRKHRRQQTRTIIRGEA